MAALIAFWACLSPSRAAANNPNMSDDFERMMRWLTGEVVQGLSFNAGSTFDPPNELKKWRMQPDVSLGLGMIPLDKTKFPVIVTPSLAERDPSAMLPDKVSIPNLALHVRLGLPGRFDFTVRAADMTVPNGYRLAPGTRAKGQSNSIGFGLRRHFGGGDEDIPRITVGANYNHVKGYFNFNTERQLLQLTSSLAGDSWQMGRLEWNVNSFGLNTVVSQTFGSFTPFFGAGGNYTTGSMKARLEMDCLSPIICTPVIGEASDHPEQVQARGIFGAQYDLTRVSLFLNGEVKALGENAGRTFIVQMGIVAPFRIGWGSIAAKGTHWLAPDDKGVKDSFDVDESERARFRGPPAAAPKTKGAPKKPSSQAGSEPEPLFIPGKWDQRDEKPKRPSRRKIDAEPELILPASQ